MTIYNKLINNHSKLCMNALCDTVIIFPISNLLHLCIYSCYRSMHSALETLHRFTVTYLFILIVKFVQFTNGKSKLITNNTNIALIYYIYNIYIYYILSFSFVALHAVVYWVQHFHNMHGFTVATLFIPTIKFVQVTYDQNK